MPKGPKGESRSADVIGNAVKVAKLVTGEQAEDQPAVSPGAALGKLGGQSRAWNITPGARAEQAKKAAAKGGI